MISKGKLLSDGPTVSDSPLKENDLIMILVVKSQKEKKKTQDQQIAQNEDLINELVNEGFEREEVLDALTSTNFDRDRALDILENGYPEDLMTLGNPSGNILAMDEGQIDNLDDEEFNVAIDGIIEQFFTDPAFREIRERLRQNPDSVDELMTQVQQLNPTFHDILRDNPEIVDEIVEGVNEFTEEELEEDQWEDVPEDEDGQADDLNQNRKTDKF